MAKKPRGLDEKQLTYARWLAKPECERVPPTKKELAKELGIVPQTLMAWQKAPEIIKAADSAMKGELRAMVPDAIALYKKAIQKPGSISKTSADVAKDIIKTFGERTAHSDVPRNIVEMYNTYHSDDKLPVP